MLAEGDLKILAERVRRALEAAREIDYVELDPQARAAWAKMYMDLLADRSGLLAATTQRAAPQVRRLSMIYSLLDGSGTVRLRHLKAAREVWRYCADSAQFVVGDDLDPGSKMLLEAISAAKDGLDGTQIRDLFGRHARSKDTTRRLQQLEAAGLIAKVKEKTGGRPRTRWVACRGSNPKHSPG